MLEKHRFEMKVALVQLDADDALWKINQVGKILDKVGTDVGLIVFPEAMPFDKPLKLDEAISLLENIVHPVPAILGGYVNVDGKTVNRSFLLQSGKILGDYDKQVAFDEGDLETGSEVKVFQFGESGCIPLICADAYREKGPEFVELMWKINQKMSGRRLPIVVSSYGAGLDDEDGWQDSLFTLANFCQVPVVICGVSGTSKEPYFDEETGAWRYYGGGGSAVFWPHEITVHSNIKLPDEAGKIKKLHTLTTWRSQEHSPQLDIPAIFVIDLDTRDFEIRSLY